MRRKILLFIKFLVLNVLLIHQANAQSYTYFTIPVTAGGTSGAGRGPVTSFAAHRSCAIYPAADFAGIFNPGDTIFRAGYILTTPITTGVSGNMRIFMVNTSDAGFLKNTLWDSIVQSRGAMDTVYNGSMTIPNVAGPYFVTLQKPFVYTGGGVYVAYQWEASPPATTAAVYSCNTGVVNGQRNIQGASLATLGTLTGASSFRPQLYLGKKTPTNDAQVVEVYSLGKMPIPFASPYSVRARVKNLGSDTLLDRYFYVRVRPVNNLLDSILVDSLLPGQEKTISFPGYSSLNTGTDTVRVFCAPDNNNANNSKIYGQIVNLNTYNYADPFKIPTGGVGFTGATGDFVAKFPYSGSNSINQVGVNFSAGGTTLKVGIWDTTALGTPGTLLWESAPFATTAGLNTIPVNPPVPIGGTFFVGVRQTGTVNASFSFQAETPIRGQTFYYTSPTGNTVWTDFLTTNSNFRFMVEPRLQLANDLGVTSINSPCESFPIGQSFNGTSASVYNYGSNTQFGVPVKMQVRNATNAIVFSDSASVSFISAAASANVSFPNTFSPTVAGTYTIKTWTELPGDGDKNNDTAYKTIIVQSPILGTTAGTRLQFDGADDYILINNNQTVKPLSNFTIESWVRISNAVGSSSLYSLDSSLNDTSLTININGLTPQVVIKTTNGYLSVNSSKLLNFNSWAHLALVYSGTSLRLFVNGQIGIDTALTGDVVSSGRPIYIGRRAGLGAAFNGGLENYQYWNTALSTAEIRLNMHRKRMPMSNANIMQMLRFDDGVGASIMGDLSGNCNPGFLNNFDFNNLTATPAWFNSSLPLDTGLANIQTITSSASQSFAGKNISLSFANMSGTTEVAAHYFREQPLGFLPDTIVTSGTKTGHNRYWILYNYGTPTYDSALATFIVPSGNIGNSALDSIFLAIRESGSSGLWTMARNTADTLNLSNQSVRFWLPATNAFAKQYGIASNTSTNPLPVKYAFFKGSISEGDAILNWATALEINNSHFVIERSTDGIFYTAIGKVMGMGNASKLSNYQFEDSKAFGLGYATLYYRLRQVDNDGTENLSNVVILSIEEENILVKGIMPNPFAAELVINLQMKEDIALNFELIDINGKTMFNKQMGLEAGQHQIYLDEAGQLPGGIYFLKLTYQGKQQTFKLVKMRN